MQINPRNANWHVVVMIPSEGCSIEQLDWFLCFEKKRVVCCYLNRMEQHNGGAPNLWQGCMD